MKIARRHRCVFLNHPSAPRLACSFLAVVYFVTYSHQHAIFPLTASAIEANNAEYEKLFERKFQFKEDKQLSVDTIIWPRNWKKLMECGVLPPSDYGTDTEKLYTSQVLTSFLPTCDGYIFLPSTSCAEHLRIFIRDVLPLMKRPFALISADGDASFPGSLWRSEIAKLLNHPLLLRWYTQNYDGTTQHPKLYALPIGLDLHTSQNGRPTDTSELFAELYQERQHAMLTIPTKRHPEPLLPMWSALGRHRDRHLLPALLETCGIRYTRQESWESSTDLAQNYFSTHISGFSPHGAGLDSHRTFEMLWYGMIPIVKTSSLDVLYRNRLPVMVLGDWREICSDSDSVKNMLQDAEGLWPPPDTVFTMPYWLAPG